MSFQRILKFRLPSQKCAPANLYFFADILLFIVLIDSTIIFNIRWSMKSNILWRENRASKVEAF